MKSKKWIINSLLDLDFYKLTMLQLIFIFFRLVPVRFGFKNRTIKVRLAQKIDLRQLNCELRHVEELRATEEELAYLRESRFIKRGFFRETFLEFFKNLKLPPVKVGQEDGQLIFDIQGYWSEASLWETIILSIVNELYYRELMRKLPKAKKTELFAEGKKRLWKKIGILKTISGILFSDFGTRRRFSREWQEYVVRTLAKELPEQFLGTSNVYLAMKYDLRPIGTFAHELFMVFSGIFRDLLRESHNKVLQYWWDLYGEALSIALTDTYGTDFFFRDMTDDQAKKWRGLRHDSGDPIEFGEKAIRFYQEKGIDPTTKTIVFSDGLDLEMIIKIYKHFQGRIKVVFGWGTNLTNDFGLPTLSLIVKAIEAAGHGLVKLSDNLAKAMGSSGDIELFKETFGHTATLNEACTY